MNRSFSWPGLVEVVFIWMVLTPLVALSSTLNYQGRIAVDGDNYTGPGYFRFALLNDDGDILWTNAGEQPNEPSIALTLDINNGLFQVELGNDELMEPIPPLTFHERVLWLRTWFSDGGMFEQLSPDVRVNALDFARFNTGRTLIVDQNGGGAFRELQPAINAYSEGGYDIILIKPGVYHGAITIPTNTHAFIRGESKHAVWLTSDEALFTMSLNSTIEIENVTLSAAPVLSDADLPGEDEIWEGTFSARQCIFIRSEAYGPVVDLQIMGMVELVDCALYNPVGGSIFEVSGNSSLHVARSKLETEFGPALVAANGFVQMESCDFYCHNGPAVQVSGETGYLRVMQSYLSSTTHPALEARERVNARFVNSRFRSDEPDVPTVLIQDIDGGMEFRECEIVPWSSGPVIVLQGGTAWVRFENTSIDARNGTGLLLDNYEGHVLLDHSRINTQNAPALELIASEEGVEEVFANLHYTSIYTGKGVGSHEAPDAIVLRNMGVEEEAHVEVRLYATRVEGFARDGVRLEGPGRAEIGMEAGSMVDALRNGITAMGGGVVFIDGSEVVGEEGYGIQLAGPALMFAMNARIGGEEGGLRLDYDDDSMAMIDRSNLMSFDGPPLTVQGGRVMVNQTTALFGLAPGVVIGNPDTQVRFSHCVFANIETLFGEESDVPAVRLLADGEDNTASPIFMACTFEPDAGAEFSIDAEAAATITLVNSVLTRPYNSEYITLDVKLIRDDFGNTLLGASEVD